MVAQQHLAGGPDAMIIGHRWWILIWYGILLIGCVGLGAAVYWGRRTAWRNLDEILRAVGTIIVSVGMLLMLHEVDGPAAELLLGVAVLAFVAAFRVGRRGTGAPAPDLGAGE